MAKLQHLDTQEKLLGNKLHVLVFLILCHTCVSLNTGLIPKRYTNWRWHKIYNPFADIRKNLFVKHESKQTYDMHFFYYKIKSTTYKNNCNLQDLPTVGDIVCVQCQNFYNKKNICKNSDRLFSKSSFYYILNSNCYGTWVKITEAILGECFTMPSYVIIKQNE